MAPAESMGTEAHQPGPRAPRPGGPAAASLAEQGPGASAVASATGKAGSLRKARHPSRNLETLPKKTSLRLILKMENLNFSRRKPARIPEISIYSLLGGGNCEASEPCLAGRVLHSCKRRGRELSGRTNCSSPPPVTLPPSLHTPGPFRSIPEYSFLHEVWLKTMAGRLSSSSLQSHCFGADREQKTGDRHRRRPPRAAEAAPSLLPDLGFRWSSSFGVGGEGASSPSRDDELGCRTRNQLLTLFLQGLIENLLPRHVTTTDLMPKKASKCGLWPEAGWCGQVRAAQLRSRKAERDGPYAVEILLSAHRVAPLLHGSRRLL